MSFESALCRSVARGRAFDLDLAHVRDVEDTGARAHRPVLGDHALVLNGHLPAGERHQASTERDVAFESGVRRSVCIAARC